MTRLITLCNAVVLLALLFATMPALPYSVQTHESLIDLAWKESIRPLLVKRFPGSPSYSSGRLMPMPMAAAPSRILAIIPSETASFPTSLTTCARETSF